MPATSTSSFDPSAYWIERERREREQRLTLTHRVAWLVGFYGSRAEHTGNADLAELVAELRKAIDLPDES